MPPTNPLAAPPIAPSAFPPKSIAPSISIPPIGDSSSNPNGAPIPDAISAPPRTFEPICAIPFAANLLPNFPTTLLPAFPIPVLASLPTPPLATPPNPLLPALDIPPPTFDIRLPAFPNLPPLPDSVFPTLDNPFPPLDRLSDDSKSLPSSAMSNIDAFSSVAPALLSTKVLPIMPPVERPDFCKASNPSTSILAIFPILLIGPSSSFEPKMFLTLLVILFDNDGVCISLTFSFFQSDILVKSPLFSFSSISSFVIGDVSSFPNPKNPASFSFAF